MNKIWPHCSVSSSSIDKMYIFVHIFGTYLICQQNRDESSTVACFTGGCVQYTLTKQKKYGLNSLLYCWCYQTILCSFKGWGNEKYSWKALQLYSLNHTFIWSVTEIECTASYFCAVVFVLWMSPSPKNLRLGQDHKTLPAQQLNTCAIDFPFYLTFIKRDAKVLRCSTSYLLPKLLTNIQNLYM